MVKFASLKTHICTPAYTAYVSYESRELGSCPSHLARHRIALAADSSSTILASFVRLFTWNVLCVGNGTNRPMACSLLCTLWEWLWILSWKGCLHLPLPWSLWEWRRRNGSLELEWIGVLLLGRDCCSPRVAGGRTLSSSRVPWYHPLKSALQSGHTRRTRLHSSIQWVQNSCIQNRSTAPFSLSIAPRHIAQVACCEEEDSSPNLDRFSRCWDKDVNPGANPNSPIPASWDEIEPSTVATDRLFLFALSSISTGAWDDDGT